MLAITASSLPSFASRTCLITGGSSGIGYSTALLLSSLGCNVLIGDLQPPPPSLPKEIGFLRTDLTDYSALLALFDQCKTTFGTYPDLVFANAGIGECGELFAGVSDAEIRVEPKHEVLDLDLKATANTIRLAWWGMKKEGIKGSIVVTASLAGYAGAGITMYNAAKHGVVGMVRSLRFLGPRDNISISLVAPALTTTAILTTPTSSFTDVAASISAAGVPLNTPERVAEVVAYLMGLGKEANGMGLLVQGGKVVDLERGIAGSRKSWMGEEVAKDYEEGVKGTMAVFLRLAQSMKKGKL